MTDDRGDLGREPAQPVYYLAWAQRGSAPDSTILDSYGANGEVLSHRPSCGPTLDVGRRWLTSEPVREHPLRP
jgi:hypothetical protein